ncbi:MAG: hypothetical protein ACYCZD_03945 [Rhodanobacter sp.]
MAELHLTKQAAAQRQLDAAVRILFTGEDVLAVHTIVAAAHNVLTDLDNKSGKTSLALYADTLSKLQKAYPGIPLPQEAAEFKAWLQRKNRSGANFLKHADKDSAKALDPSTLSTDHLLLEACGIYRGLGLEPTQEMNVFGHWHLAVYPSQVEDRVITKSGDVSEFNRGEQLEFGLFLLETIS